MNGQFNEPGMIVYRTPFRNVIIPLREDNLVGLTYSGGADSVILLYCLVANGYLPDRLIYIYDDTPEVVAIKSIAMYECLEYIENKFNVDLKSRLVMLAQDKKEMARVVIFEAMEECDVLYTGTTQNPRNVTFENVYFPQRPPTGMVNKFSRYENPFGTFDKRATIYLYNLLGVNDLLDLSRSCAATTPEPCGVCFHCQERKWAIEEVAKINT